MICCCCVSSEKYHWWATLIGAKWWNLRQDSFKENFVQRFQKKKKRLSELDKTLYRYNGGQFATLSYGDYWLEHVELYRVAHDVGVQLESILIEKWTIKLDRGHCMPKLWVSMMWRMPTSRGNCGISSSRGKPWICCRRHHVILESWFHAGLSGCCINSGASTFRILHPCNQ